MVGIPCYKVVATFTKYLLNSLQPVNGSVIKLLLTSILKLLDLPTLGLSRLFICFHVIFRLFLHLLNLQLKYVYLASRIAHRVHFCTYDSGSIVLDSEQRAYATYVFLQ